MARTRAPGAGRKPQGPIQGKTSNFSTRISADTRGLLEAEAKYSGHSISQVAERWLQIGAETSRHREIEDPVRALAYVLNIIEDQTRYLNEDDKYCTWRNDVFAFEAFRAATQMLFGQLKPAGELKSPREIDGIPTERTVAQHAEFAFSGVWKRLQANAPRTPAEVENSLPARKTPRPDRNIGMISQASYADERARRALDIRRKSEPKTPARHKGEGE